MNRDSMAYWMALVCREEREERHLAASDVAGELSVIDVEDVERFEEHAEHRVSLDVLVDAYCGAFMHDGPYILWGRATARWLEAEQRGSAEWFIKVLEEGALHVVDLIRGDMQQLMDRVNALQDGSITGVETIRQLVMRLDAKLERRSKHLVQIGSISQRLAAVEEQMERMSQMIEGAVPLEGSIEDAVSGNGVAKSLLLLAPSPPSNTGTRID